jgi:hypothetical protein
MTGLRKRAKQWLERTRLPPAARAALRLDEEGVPAADPGPTRVIEEGVAWLARAQDHSATQDGGVARHYSLIDGWAASYPETTGYIIPTLIDFGRMAGRKEPIDRARRMLEWLAPW